MMEKSFELNESLIIDQKNVLVRPNEKYKLLAYLGFGLLVLAAFAFSSSFYQGLFIEMMVYALLAMSLDLLVGYTGLVSFGHAAFFGLSAYTTGIFMNTFGFPFFISMIIAIFVTVLTAFIVGLLCARLSGIQFAMLTLAFGQLIWTIITKWRSVTNGMDGFSVSQGALLKFGNSKMTLADPQLLLFLVAATLLLSHWSIQRMVRSPFGQALLAIKENEERAKFIGFNHYRIKVQVFVFSAFYAALAGGCFVLLKMFVAPDYLNWTFSGNILMMTLLGGVGTLTGPLLGAVTFVWFQDWASSLTDNWMAFVGIIFILVVLYLPNGVFGWLFKRR